MNESQFWAAMDAYKAAFGEYFPTEECYLSDSDLIEVMTACINDGTPYEANQGTPEGAVL